jgi:hypothetical protein
MRRTELVQIIKEETGRVLKERNKEAQIPGAEGLTASWLYSQLTQIQQALPEGSPVFDQVSALVRAVAPEEKEKDNIRNADGSKSRFARRSTSAGEHFRNRDDTSYVATGGNDGNTALARDRQK